ncbi:MAG: hypothetical protein KAJ24_04810 [Candidatus Aenigmarchaeota archaeon]|nr:hypothetical protein [Candidatus Aenigmarchaeota archaeon]
MDEKHENISINENGKTVTIKLNPRLYSQSVIMRAAYRFTEDFDVAVDGDPLDKITVVFKVCAEDKKEAKKEDLEAISAAFHNELLHASVEETQARRYADTRNALIGAAVRQLMPMNIDPRAIAENLNSYADKKGAECEPKGKNKESEKAKTC